MGFFVTIKALVFRKKEVKLIQDSPATPTSPVRNVPRYATLIASATAARGVHAEEVFPRIMQQAAHHRSVVTIRAPLSSGVLASWVDEVTSNGSLSLSEINRLVGIESSSSALDALGIVCTVAVRPAARRPLNRRRALPATWEDSDGAASVELEETLTTEDHAAMHHSRFTECTLRVEVPEGSPIARPSDIANSDHWGPPPSPSTTLVNEDPESPSAKPRALLALDDFSIVRRLGQGAFGSVFLVKHTATGTRAALKVIQKKTKAVTAEDGSRADKISTIETALRWAAVFQEQHAMRRVRGSPGLVDIMGSFHDTRNFYLVSPYYAGGDLQGRLDKFRRFPEDQTCIYGAEILAGLEALHKRGIIHRDLKPANILIDAEGHLVISDMGLSKVFKREEHKVLSRDDPFLTSLLVGPAGSPELTDLSCGTPEYIAPEMWMNKSYSYGVDIWAFGVMLFEMLVGHVPWEVKMFGLCLKDAITSRPFVLENREREEYLIGCNAIRFIEKILEKNPDKRPEIDDLKYHHFFRTINWKKLSGRETSVPWIPMPRSDAHDVSKGDPPVINSGSSYERERDPLPHFTFVSPVLLASAPSPTLFDVPASPDRSTASCVASANPSPDQVFKSSLDSFSSASRGPDACPGDTEVAISHCGLPQSSTAGSFHTIDMSNISLDVGTMLSNSDSRVVRLGPSASHVDVTNTLGTEVPLPDAPSHHEVFHIPQASAATSECISQRQSNMSLADVGQETSIHSKSTVFSHFKRWAAGLASKLMKAWTRLRA